MGDVAEDVENIELHGGLLRGTNGDTARGLSHVTGSPSLTRKIRSGREGVRRCREWLCDGV
jgi:hypothetical protein